MKIKREKWAEMGLGMAIFSGVLLALFLLVGIPFISYATSEETILQQNIEITAHRGASKIAPENTMSAFRKAKELGADWIELDVQETKDEKVVVSHDANLKRTTGKNINIWETNYKEITKLSANAGMNEFKGEKIPLLEEVLKFAKENGVRLNIELKSNGHEKKLEERTLNLVKKYGLKDQCVLTSQNYKMVEKVKELDNEIKTLFVGSATRDLMSLTAADNFSLEISSTSKQIVEDLHNRGREVLLWTANTESKIDKAIWLGADNIITDDVNLTRERIEQARNLTGVDRFWWIVKNWF